MNPTQNRTQAPSTRRATVQIKNKLGLHLRPASSLVKLASRYDGCEISISKDHQCVNAKSIMGVIMLAAEQGSVLIIEVTGKSADDALSEIEQLIASGFGEE